MSEKSKILIIEDEEDIASFIQMELDCEGYDVDVASDGTKGLMALRKFEPDLVILDRMLPQMNGIEVCKRIKQTTDIPVIMLTALGETDDKVEGLDAGANDYLVKPFALNELLARIRVQIRQRKPQAKTKMEFEGLSLDTLTREVKREGKLINLSPKEFDLLSLLMTNPKHVITKDRIIETVWGWDFDGDDNVLEVCMHGLREKIESKDLPRLIHTVRGIGYVIKTQA